MRAFRTHRAQSGFLLLEALVGAAIFSFGVLAIMTMQSNAMRSVAGSSERAVATSLMQRIHSLMRVHTLATPAGLNVIAIASGTTCPAPAGATADVQAWATDVVRLLPGSTCSIVIGAESARVPCHREAIVTLTWTDRGVRATGVNRADNVFYIPTVLGSTAARPIGVGGGSAVACV